ncbi:zinc finger (CCCH type) motif-containing protein [Cardiosporidium cionae]|uniref:Zinc finger (CCCH type) motif-containing protein n=1 Tax=Cardiosporidium cionae TaxID=476202 RepID=A0ABQ7J7A3_9APIC|nr:zinc finger (CCCH type) motif-containing protein [Cardiosporidium cionae]|eukprot:KAF8819859.1 zinc finger (CCCH type) motif-containing protein [Cardiosporidium cionae]
MDNASLVPYIKDPPMGPYCRSDNHRSQETSMNFNSFLSSLFEEDSIKATLDCRIEDPRLDVNSYGMDLFDSLAALQLSGSSPKESSLYEPTDYASDYLLNCTNEYSSLNFGINDRKPPCYEQPLPRSINTSNLDDLITHSNECDPNESTSSSNHGVDLRKLMAALSNSPVEVEPYLLGMHPIMNGNPSHSDYCYEDLKLAVTRPCDLLSAPLTGEQTPSATPTTIRIPSTDGIMVKPRLYPKLPPSLAKRLEKTQLCRHFQRNGKCANGTNCAFAHAIKELRRKPVLFKTRICSAFQVGKCVYGENCQHAHSEAELRVTPEFYKTALCPEFSRHAYCCKGKKCRFAHGSNDLRGRPFELS